ncbi:MAG: hypothetical protein KKB50_12315 [Planctomycetes bacterium]|nr:hypothetical protein [Planctomycetota bacterium]
MADMPADNQPVAAADAATTASPGDTAPVALSPPIVDVWSRTEPKYRIRAAILLVVNAALFSGLCVFMYWVHEARLFEFSWDSYVGSLRLWDLQAHNLNDVVLYPINVTQTPLHGAVLGLLLAAIVAVPIVVSMLYRFGCALPFLLAVLVFAHLPWMAVTLTFSCVLASVRPFRLSFRYCSALVGMLPVLVYLLLACRGSPGQLGADTSPAQEFLLRAPWVLAILAACVMMGAMLAIARIVNYRPGAVAPVMAVMFATPALVFQHSVGVDELKYRVLETEYGLHSERFAPVQDATDQIRALMLGYTPQRAEVLQVLSGRTQPIQQRVSQWFTRRFLVDRAVAYEAASRFIADHPTSRYVPCALYLQGRVMDTRLDSQRLREAASRELYSDFPHAQSETAWAALLKEHSESPLASVAALRLAQLRLRQGKIDEALALLEPLRGLEVPDGSNPHPAVLTLRELLQPAPAESSLGYKPQPDMLAARRLYELIAANRDDPKYGNRPLQELAALDHRRSRYTEQLLHLANRYPDSLLYDNLIVCWARTLIDLAHRADRLMACVRRFPDGDAGPEALFRLAEVETQALGRNDDARREAGIARFGLIAERYGTTSWGQEAAERLKMLVPQARPHTEGAVPQ